MVLFNFGTLEKELKDRTWLLLLIRDQFLVVIGILKIQIFLQLEEGIVQLKFGRLQGECGLKFVLNW